MSGVGIVIPTFREAANIAALVRALLAEVPDAEIVIVDDTEDSSTVDAAADVAGPSVRLVHRAKKDGRGSAVLTGMRVLLEETDARPLVEMDADFSHDPNHLPQFLAAVKDADLVLGSRYRHGKVTVVNWPIARLILSYSANVYARAVTGLPLYDATGGFKCFRRAVLEAIDLDDVRSNGYAFQIEMSFRAWRRGYRIVEIPIVFVDRTEGESKMSKKIVREAIWMVWRLRWWAIRGRV